jgi:hypothetical protein
MWSLCRPKGVRLVVWAHRAVPRNRADGSGHVSAAVTAALSLRCVVSGRVLADCPLGVVCCLSSNPRGSLWRRAAPFTTHAVDPTDAVFLSS